MGFHVGEKGMEIFLAIIVTFVFILSLFGIVYGQVKDATLALILAFGALLPIMIWLWISIVSYYILLNREYDKKFAEKQESQEEEPANWWDEQRE